MLTLTLIETISLIFPALFKNDPFLLVVCGFEKYNLHHASSTEKISLLSMIIFFFLVLNAYGTKMIAFMTDKPSVGNIETLKELADSGLKITADLVINDRFASDQRLGSMMVHKPINLHSKLDGEHAHLCTDLEAAFLVSLRRNYHFKLNRPKYLIVSGWKETRIIYYIVGWISPFAEMFYYTQKVFFESGIFNHWEKTMVYFSFSEDRKDYQWIEISGMLYFDDLVSTWMVLTVGLLVSLVAFVFELLLQYCNHYWNKLRLMLNYSLHILKCLPKK